MPQTDIFWPAISSFASLAAAIYAAWSGNWRWTVILQPVDIHIFGKPFAKSSAPRRRISST